MIGLRLRVTAGRMRREKTIKNIYTMATKCRVNCLVKERERAPTYSKYDVLLTGQSDDIDLFMYWWNGVTHD